MNIRKVFLVFILFELLTSGLIAQTVLISNNTWKASTNLYSNWTTLAFNDVSWANATSPSPNGGTPVISGTQSMWASNTNVDTVYFRKKITISNPVTSATVQITADNAFQLYVNGTLVGSGNNWATIYNFNIQPYLLCGNNVIAIKGIEWHPGSSSLVTFKATINTSTSTCSPLPVELVKFDATLTEQKVKLSWSTASEINNDFFEIERSVDSKEFESLQRLHGLGTTSVYHDYEYIDNHPVHGISYYRLKQVDFDGNFTYSDIKEINYQKNVNSLIAVPNPVNNETVIYFPFNIKGDSRLELKGINGNVIMSKKISADLSFYKLDFVPAEKGVYIFTVYNDGLMLKCKLVVM